MKYKEYTCHNCYECAPCGYGVKYIEDELKKIFKSNSGAIVCSCEFLEQEDNAWQKYSNPNCDYCNLEKMIK